VVTDAASLQPITILLVENEEAIRSFISYILTEEGFTLLIAQDGLEALQQSRDLSQAIDLLITDIFLPGELTGVQVAQQLKADRPGLKCLYISGFPADELIQRGIIQARWPFLWKPFKTAALLTKIDEVLSDADFSSKGASSTWVS
jgi:CheY-like chemotaxis protein